MTRSLMVLLLTLSFVSTSTRTDAQASVKWEVKAIQQSPGEAQVRITATISEGWHLYSQHIADGGPQPTRILFDRSQAFELFGSPQESGLAHSFYDSLYEMHITWYNKTATFLQQIRLREPKARATGRIEYMVCNDHVCVPGKQSFSIELLTIP